MIRVLLATPDRDLATRSETVLQEVGNLEVSAIATNASEVLEAITDEDTPLDVLILHEDLGPLPVLDLARDLNHRYPQLAVVLLSADPSIDLLRAAMSAGVRSVTRLPLSLTELSAAVIDASEWSTAVQEQLTAATEHQRSDRLRGRVIAVAGAKGGVGTTTVAVQLALALQRRDDGARACLVDLDLQTGDVRGYLDISHRRSVTDLIEVASELTTGHLADAMYAHPTGLRILLPPRNGEDAEDLDGRTMARILGGIRSRFDTVILDVGAVSTDASATAIELADEVVLVCTPDVVSLRAANRAVAMWQRLALRDSGVRAVLNRSAKDREIQPSLAARVVSVPFVDVTLPDRPQDVEQATNTGSPERLDGPLRRQIEKLAAEIGSGRPRSAGAVDAARSEDREQALVERVASDQRGSIAAEFVGLILPIAAVLLLVWQFVLVGYTSVLATRAAQDGARVLALEGRDQDAIEEAAEERLHGYWRRELRVAQVRPGERQVRVTIPAPILYPGIGSPWRVSGTAGAVIEGAPAPIELAVAPEHADESPTEERT